MHDFLVPSTASERSYEPKPERSFQQVTQLEFLSNKKAGHHLLTMKGIILQKDIEIFFHRFPENYEQINYLKLKKTTSLILRHYAINCVLLSQENTSPSDQK
jgi:hypothetical protein